MDDLTKCLYGFVCRQRMGSVYDDPEYEEVSHSVELQTKKARKSMSEEQLQELDLLLETISAHHSIENEYLFQAALRLAGELNALVRA